MRLHRRSFALASFLLALGCADRKTAGGITACREEITARLASPATAQFGRWQIIPHSRGPDGVQRTYAIEGEVDAQNAFGALMRNGLRCVVTTNRETGEWHVMEARITPR